MEKNNTFIITIPKFPKKGSPKAKTKDNNVEGFKKSIKSQYDEIISYQDVDVTEKNKKELENLVFATEDLIGNCMNDEIYCGNRDQYFVNLIYICHKISLRIETYKLQEKIQILEGKSEEITQKQQKSEEQSNNLVYNILGFIASFSIVSSAVVAIDNMKSTSDILLFMAFTAFILITTLIGLHNFYKSKDKSKNKLQDNYFLWKMLIIVIVLLIGYRGVEYVKENRNEILESIGRGIGQSMQENK